MATNKPTLSESFLKAVQYPSRISANPAGLSEHLVRQTQPSNEPVDLDSEISKQIEALSGALTQYEETNGQPNVELIAAAQVVDELQVKLNEATHRLEQVKSLGTPLDRLRRATALAENRLTNLIGEYSRIVTAELLLERFGQEVNVLKLSPATRQEIRLHRRLDSLRSFEPLRTSGETNADTEQRLQLRADVAGERLTALREHISNDQKENAKK
jgi:hypothetical protein